MHVLKDTEKTLGGHDMTQVIAYCKQRGRWEDATQNDAVKTLGGCDAMPDLVSYCKHCDKILEYTLLASGYTILGISRRY